MITLFNVWHYLVIGIIFILFVLGIILSIRQPKKKLVIPMIITVTLFSMLFTGFSLGIIDKYTKKVTLYKMTNKRLLSLEKIVYKGVVKNEGDYEIGEVTFEIKLVNKGHVAGSARGGSYFEASGFFNFFTGGANVLYKPQSITKKFIVARHLKPGQAKAFSVNFDYPAYFKNTAHYAKVYGN